MLDLEGRAAMAMARRGPEVHPNPPTQRSNGRLGYQDGAPVSVEDVRRLIGEARHAPYGAGKIALAEEAIRLADALDDRRLRFDARMAGTEAYQMGGEPAKGFVTFSWCLAEYDRDPSGFDVWDDELLRWHFKWVV